jgi:small GTP-binding protein
MGMVYKVVMVGDFGVGKTSLIRRFVENSFSEEYLSTIGVSISKKLLPDSTIMLWDIEGHTEFKPIHKQYLLGAKAFMIVADLTRDETIDNIKNHIENCLSVSKNAPIVIALNKCDLVEDGAEPHIEKLKQLSPLVIEVASTSAKTAHNVENLFLHLDRFVTKKS